MGYPMAGHAARKVGAAGGGSELRVWNREADRAAEHSAEHGSVAAGHIRDLADCAVVFSCLPTTREVRAVAAALRGARAEAGATAGCLWVDCSSGDPAGTRALRLELAGCGIDLVDCPVSGGPRGAAQGTLTAMLGGGEDVERALPLVRAFASKVERCGPVGAGMAIKAVNNLLNATHVMIATEALLALKRAGVDPATALAVINKSSGRSLQTEVRLPEEVLTRRFGYGFKLGLMHKDCSTAAGMLSLEGSQEAPLLLQSSKMVGAAHAMRGADVDYTELACWVEQNAGLTLAPTGSTHGNPPAGGTAEPDSWSAEGASRSGRADAAPRGRCVV